MSILRLAACSRKLPSWEGLRPEPAPLSIDLYARFLDRIAPMRPLVASIMLQFEYLNKRKVSRMTPTLQIDRSELAVRTPFVALHEGCAAVLYHLPLRSLIWSEI
ncbi:MAG: hypothetical protein ACOC2Y_06395 [Spirochaetota bacterium]